jgi:hypothetical protein
MHFFLERFMVFAAARKKLPCCHSGQRRKKR